MICIRTSLPALCLALPLIACGAPPPEANPDSDPAAPAATGAAREAPAAPVAAPKPAAPPSAPRWETAASGEGDALFLAGPDGTRLVTLFCPADTDDLLVNVPAFDPIASEE